MTDQTNLTKAVPRRRSRVRRVLVGGVLVGTAMSAIMATTMVEPAFALPRDCVFLRNEARDYIGIANYYSGLANAYIGMQEYDLAEQAADWSSGYIAMANYDTSLAQRAGC